MDTRKEAICNALAAFIRQRPGLEWANYATSNHRESVAAYRADQRSIARDKRDAEALLLAVRHNDGITADDMLAAASGGGRLEIREHTEKKGYWGVDWCTGQYWCVEYRAGVARYCAGLLWDWQREHMPAPRIGADDSREYPLARAANGGTRHVSAGDWLRRKFRQDFGSALQKRWFD